MVDSLRLEDYRKLEAILKARYGVPLVGGVYWVPLPETICSPLQLEHEECRPHVVALDLEENRLCCEFLIRTRKAMHCGCMGYADTNQRGWIMDTVDALLEEACVIV
ncbi:hypothetical protein OOT00_03490 [Desulfobotulus sp. H1]|uniref:Uncharacterized protein n=1 Tax=Desulfobotulus pelophilus TaxID=2823377 RepID=A0ABT3N7A9_9BACT|nr:hypothetical protein [Desulfobotulus pelophilus]MCW7753046.1 hypothetical protein [Desulfobotulus pelophilus]